MNKASGTQAPEPPFADPVGPFQVGVEPAARRSDRRRGRIVRVAALFVTSVCIALLVMNGWLIVRARATEIDQIARANTNLARSVSQQVQGSMALAEHIVRGIAFELERSDITPEGLQRLQPVLVNHVSQVSGLKGLFVYDEQGRWLVHSEPSLDASRNNSDRAYFIHHRTNPSTQTLISAPIVSRSSGEWVIPVSRRVNDPHGDFAGVVLATLSVTQLRLLLERFEVGEQGAIALFQSGQILVRRPFNEADLGRRGTASPLQKAFEAQRSGMTEGLSTIDGVVRIISFEHLSDYPLLVTVAVSKDEALREWKVASIYQTVWVVLLCAVIAVSGNYLVRSMRRRLSVEARLRGTRDALRLANERLAQLAQHDGLTGLANRRFFDARLSRSFEDAVKARTPLAVVMVDVDDFKKYNDRYGHLQGDECLRQVADALRTTVKRPEDFVARYGGEEMVLLLPDTDLEGALVAAENARLAVLNLELPHSASALGIVSISLGVAAEIPDASNSPVALLRAADIALYRAKERGRNRTESRF